MITFNKFVKVGKTFTASDLFEKVEEFKDNNFYLLPVELPRLIAKGYVGLTEEEIKQLHPDADIHIIPLDKNICMEVSLSSDLLSCVIDKKKGKCKSAYIF